MPAVQASMGINLVSDYGSHGHLMYQENCLMARIHCKLWCQTLWQINM